MKLVESTAPLTLKVLQTELGFNSWIEFAKRFKYNLVSHTDPNEVLSFFSHPNETSFQISHERLCFHLLREIYANRLSDEDIHFLYNSDLREKLTENNKTKVLFDKLRKFVFVLLLFVSTFGFSQQKPWEKFEMDSATFVDQFGTVAQYNYQKDIERKSTHKMLCLWTGAKPIWLNNFAMYLSNDYDVVWDDDFDNAIEIIATQKISSTAKPPKIILKASYNDRLQTTSATITGPADNLIKIYIDYWQLTDLSFNDLKTKKAITKNFVSDKVSFSWTGENPVVKVEKNPDAPIDLFALN